ncbi:MAG: DUF3367 domain-containing protein [Thermoleophilaceae bacterium]|nr:DUF3367 domain-containing protein [Thermoleophilaceae bacterium]
MGRGGRTARLARGALPAGLAALCYALAFAQRPGKAWSDTRLELSVDPALFLHRVTSVWSGTTDLGHVQSGQFVGYAFPMAPWFAATHALGVPMWVSQRLWLGSLLALAAWGAVRLMDELYGSARGPAHLAAGALFALNPYTVTFVSRGTFTLLTYAALPWLMLAAHRGLLEPRGWRAPALIGLLLASTGGGVNAAVIAWALVGPAALAVYELAVLRRPLRAAGSLAWRAAACAAVGSAWWAVPVLLQSRYGADFLKFTEQPGTIWGTTSLSESLRLLGFWVTYVGVGFGPLEPYLSVAPTYLFSRPVVVGTFLLPLLATLAPPLARRWRYAPFFALLAALALLVMFAGFPAGTPLRRALTFTYNHVASVQFLRTTYKAAPLLALSLACLAGAAVAWIVGALRSGRVRLAGLRVPAPAALVLCVVPVAAALPLFEGRAIDPALAYGSVAGWWRQALADSDRSTPPGLRAAVVPGELFGWYGWGGTVDPIGPALARRPLAVREIVPYADRRSSQLQASVDDLVQQARLVPGQLDPLLRLMGVGEVLVPADTRRLRSGSIDPADAAYALRGQALVRRPLASYGPERTHRPASGRGGPRVRLPRIRRFTGPATSADGMVRVQPLSGATVLDGDADGVTALAADGVLRPERALFYAADLDPARLRSLVGAGARLVFSDSARRRVTSPSRLRANHGPTLGPHDPISEDSPTSSPFSDPRALTTADYGALAFVRAPMSPGFALYPQSRAYAAVDGDPATGWLADPNLDAAQHYLELGLRTPRDVAAVRVLPHADAVSRTTELGVSVNGGSERKVRLRPGWSTVPLDARPLRTLRLRVTGVEARGRGGAGGIDELRIPGLRAVEALRLPTTLAQLARGLDLSRAEVDIALERTTADFPYRAGADVGVPQRRDPVHMVDAEAGIERIVTLPEARAFGASGWASVAPAAPDPLIDRLVGFPRGFRLSSSSRFEGVPGRRASSAFDGDPRSAWVGDRGTGRPPWIAFRAPRAVRIAKLRILPGPPEYAAPARVRVVAAGAAAPALRVGPDGVVRLPRPLRTRAARVEIVAARAPRGREARRRLAAVAIGELRVPGLRAPRPRRTGSFASACGALRIGAMRARVRGSVRALDAGEPLRLESCGGGLALPAGTSRLSAPPGAVFRPDHLLLTSPPPAGPPVAPQPPGTVVSQGRGDWAARDGARLALRAPAWLVLAQSWSDGWRAFCRDASGTERALGRPVPVDGFANGWRVGPDCREARFEFAPQRLALVGYALSAVGCASLLAVLLAGALRRRARPRLAAPPAWVAEPPADPRLRVGLPAAVGAGAAVAALTWFVFALRAGAALGLATVALLRVGVSARRLLWLAAACVAALPVVYLLFPARNDGGFNPDYANDLLGAHWIAVGAVCALAAGSLLAAAALRSRERRVSAAAPGSRSSTSAPRVPAGDGR